LKKLVAFPDFSGRFIGKKILEKKLASLPGQF
jgi:hypothetical protein